MTLLWNKYSFHIKSQILFAKFLDSPLLLTERTSIVLFDPEAHAALVKAVVTVAPDHHTVLPSPCIQFGL